MDTLKCPTCTGRRSNSHVLCPSCWGQLPTETRRRLRLRDDQAHDRRHQLSRAIAERVPLPIIHVSR
ncbi:hypothetical protein AB0D38_36845 [Streptomyces sp. NPDC048279]|uniref:hypothetical protein n=1 Tax=Streptomyces sp. NPDC048279 TaxID=3154714 RepID=UPI00343BB73E